MCSVLKNVCLVNPVTLVIPVAVIHFLQIVKMIFDTTLSILTLTIFYFGQRPFCNISLVKKNKKKILNCPG